MKKNKFPPGQSGNPATQFKAGNPHRWQPGTSGNPAGKSKYRAQFQDAFNQALISHGSAEEAAQLLWEAARAREPWAIQNVCQRFCPPNQTLKLTHEVNDDPIDFSKLSDEDMFLLDALVEKADAQPSSGENGNGAPESS